MVWVTLNDFQSFISQLCALLSTGVDNRKSLLIDKGPFDEVQKECRNLGGFLILAKSEENHWIPIKKVLHSEWRWTDGRIYGMYKVKH